MARDIKLIIGGNTRGAEAALKSLERSGAQSASIIEREFDQLGTRSDQVFKNKRLAAQNAYTKIKQSGAASASEMARSEKGLASKLKAIDTEQYGQRLSMAQKFRNNMGTIVAAAGVAYGAIRIGKAAVEEAQVFQTALVDLGKVGVTELGAVRAEIMALPDELGSATDMVRGYYQVISAGVTEPKEAMDLLTTAAKAAKAAHIDQEIVIKGLTKVMAGYGGAVATAAEAADLLFGIEKLGQTSVAELVPVIGDLASISHQVGVSQYEMGAAMSQVTQTAGSTSQAATQYKAIMVGLLKPQKTMTEALDKMGYSSGKAAVEALGLSGTLIELEKYALDSGVGMSKLFESSEALTALGPLLSSNFQNYNVALVELKNNAGAADQAFQDWSGTLEATEELFKNTVGKVMIELGEELAPTVNSALKEIATWIRDNKPEILSFVQGLGSVVEGVAAAASFAINLVRTAADVAAELSLRAESLTLSNIFNPATITGSSTGSTSASSAGSMRGPSQSFFGEPLATGANYVPRTGLYQLHRGEEVRTRSDAGRDRTGGTVTLAPVFQINGMSSSGLEKTARELAREIEPELRKLGERYTRKQ